MSTSNLPQLWHDKTKKIAKEPQTKPVLASEILWTRNFVLIAVINFLISSSGKMVDIVFPFYIHSLGGDNVIVGVASGLCALSALMMRPVCGWFMDNISRKTLFFAAVIALIIFPVTFRLFSVLLAVILLRCLYAISWSAASTASNTNACDIIPASRFGEGMGWFGLTNSLATAAAPVLGLFLMYRLDFDKMFICCSAVAMLVFVLLTRLRFYKIERNRKSQRGIPVLSRLANLFNKDALPAAMVTFLTALPCGGIATFLALYAESEPIGSAGAFFAIQAAFTGVSRIFSGKIVDFKGEGPLVYISIACFISSIFILSLGRSALLFYIAPCFMGLGFGLSIPAMQAMAVRIVPVNRRGSASSTFLCAWDVAWAFGGMLGGFLSELYGFRQMFAILSIFELFALAYYFFFARKAPSAFKVYQAKLAAQKQTNNDEVQIDD